MNDREKPAGKKITLWWISNLAELKIMNKSDFIFDKGDDTQSFLHCNHTVPKPGT